MEFEFNEFDGLLALACPPDEFASLLSELGLDPAPTLDTFAACRQWVAWDTIVRNGKPCKAPFDPASPGEYAKSNDPSTWGTRVAAERAASGMVGGGIGIQLGAIKGHDDIRLGGIDLDSCLDDGVLAPWAAAVIDRFASYAEISPSGAGIKVFFCYAATDAGALKKAMWNAETGKARQRVAWSRGTHCEIGLDVSGRYYTVTNEEWASCSSALRIVPLADLLWLIDDAGPAFLTESGDDTKPGRDESGSGYGFRFLLDQAALGFDKNAALAILSADDGKAGEWAARSSKREINRTWANAKKKADAQSPNTDASEFDELDDLADGSTIDPVTARLNLRHACVVARGRTLITTERDDGCVDFGTLRDIHAYYENDRVPTGDGKREAASRRWMRSPGRRTYPNGVTFAPGGAAAGMLNLWRGFAVEPDATASCDRFLRHVRTVICCGNTDHTDYVLGWLAHMVQRPDEKPGVALVLKGGKGTGKDTIADYVARMIGRRHAPTVAESSHIVGKFNARLENALLLHVQEGSWAGDRKAEGQLKYLVTSDRVEIERKGIDSINLPSVLRMFISANADWVVPASPDERRWAVFEVSAAHRGDEAYFSALRAEMNGRGPAALLHYLRSYDLTGFNVRAAPDTEGLRNQKLASLQNMELWWSEILHRGELSLGFDESGAWESALSVSRDGLRNRYTEWMAQQRWQGSTVGERDFGRRLREMVPALDERRPGSKNGGARSRQYIFPSLAACQEAFERWLGSSVNWDAVD